MKCRKESLRQQEKIVDWVFGIGAIVIFALVIFGYLKEQGVI